MALACQTRSQSIWKPKGGVLPYRSFNTCMQRTSTDSLGSLLGVPSTRARHVDF